MASISIREKSVGDVVILEINGTPRLCETVGLREWVFGLIGRGTTHFIIDLENTRGWGSLFVGELVSAYILCQQHSCSLKLLNPPEQFGAILAISKLDSTFEVYQTEDAALESFGAPSAAEMAA